MFKPNYFLQNCFGIALIILSIGATGSLFTGAIVKMSVAGANISVNSKLEQVENSAEQLADEVEIIKREPGARRSQLKRIEQNIDEVKSSLDQTEEKIEQDLEELSLKGL